MKVLLIYPYCLEERSRDDDVRVPPIGIYYIGALLLSRGHRVEILNLHGRQEEKEQIRQVLRKWEPDIIGFSILHANRWGGLEVARIAKDLNPGVRIIFGGVGATYLWHHLLNHFQEVEYIVLSEGEYTFLELVEYLSAGEKKDPAALKGIAFRQEGKPFKTAEREFIEDIDQLPDPSRYFTFQHVTSSRGCPWNCRFCGSPDFWKRKVRFHSPEYFVGQLENLYRKGVDFFYISDDTFTFRKDRIIAICQEILNRGLNISWFAISRVNCIDADILYWMRKAGCIQISFGVESGSERIRETILNKQLKVDDIKYAFNLTASYGILPRAYFIYGSPGENEETIQKSLDLMDEIKPLSAVFYILDIFPGTALYRDYRERCGISDDIWLEKKEDIMYFETDNSLNQEMVLDFGRKLRGGYYRRLTDYVQDLELEDREDLYPSHADFLVRLALTFTHGDYAGIEAIKDKEKTAEKLFRKSLTYHFREKAYLGLGIIYQKNGSYQESAAWLSEGLKHFSDSKSLHCCLAVSYMNLGRFREALPLLEKFKESPEAAGHLDICYKALGQAR
ncbi:MAG: radical SAM protein [Desulfurivibrionaceae bacterium]